MSENHFSAGYQMLDLFNRHDDARAIKLELEKDEYESFVKYICCTKIGITESDWLATNQENKDKYLDYIMRELKIKNQYTRLVKITNQFVNKIKNIKDFNLNIDKNEILQKIIFSDSKIINDVLLYKEGKLRNATSLIQEISNNTEVVTGEQGLLEIETTSTMMRVELSKIKPKLENISNRMKTEMNQIVAELSATFEGLCKELLEFDYRFYKDIESIAKDKKFDYSLLDKYKTIEEIKEKILDDATTNATTGDMKKWLGNTVAKCTGIEDINQLFPKEIIDDLTELYRRRNIIMHNNGEINGLYKEQNSECKQDLGEYIITDNDYLINRLNTVLDAGLILISKIFEYKDLLSLNHSIFFNDLGLSLLRDSYFSAASIVFFKMYKTTFSRIGGNNPNVFLGYFNYCLTSIIQTGELPDNEKSKVEDIISRLEKEERNDWYNNTPTYCQLCKSVLLREGNNQLVNLTKNYLKPHIDSGDITFVTNFLGLPIFMSVLDDQEFIDFKHSIKYNIEK